jgi:hypothetical protein
VSLLKGTYVWYGGQGASGSQGLGREPRTGLRPACSVPAGRRLEIVKKVLKERGPLRAIELKQVAGKRIRQEREAEDLASRFARIHIRGPLWGGATTDFTKALRWKLGPDLADRYWQLRLEERALRKAGQLIRLVKLGDARNVDSAGAYSHLKQLGSFMVPLPFTRRQIDNADHPPFLRESTDCVAAITGGSRTWPG